MKLEFDHCSEKKARFGVDCADEAGLRFLHSLGHFFGRSLLKDTLDGAAFFIAGIAIVLILGELVLRSSLGHLLLLVVKRW